ncbi:putative Glutathione peroxidase protein [Naja naja]|nr:putative Glutathione peroxidase protein [Naja naja]
MSLRRFASRTLLCGLLVGRGLTRVMVDWQSAKSMYDFHALDIDGHDVSLEIYRQIEATQLEKEKKKDGLKHHENQANGASFSNEKRCFV